MVENKDNKPWNRFIVKPIIICNFTLEVINSNYGRVLVTNTRPTFYFLPIFNVKILNKISNPTKILIKYMIANVCFSSNHLIKIYLGLANSMSFDSIIVAIIVYGSRDSMDLALHITLGVVVVQNKT